MVARTLSQLARENLAQRTGQALRILDRAGLQAASARFESTGSRSS
jgi:hypothetical protein